MLPRNFLLPRRAAILSKFSLGRRLSSMGSKVPEEEVLFDERGDKGLVTLNRPKALNALNLPMVKVIAEKVERWEETKGAVIIAGTGGKAFCAGGDVKSIVLALGKPEGHLPGRRFFENEYRLNHRLGTYKKPIVSLIDGIVMGGGVGLSVHGKYRVATEKSLFAMPETAIGLCPDVGATHFLPRLKGKLGLYLGLTGHRLRGVDLLEAGIATHYVDAEKLDRLTEALVTSDSSDLEKILQSFSKKESKNEFSLSPVMDRIEQCFQAPTVEEIISRLEKDGTDWSRETLKLLSRMSPIALKVTKLAIEQGAGMSLADCLKMEYRLSCGVLTPQSDFSEGVRALLIDKDQQPRWNPKCLEDVTDERVQAFFAKIPEGGDLSFPL